MIEAINFVHTIHFHLLIDFYLKSSFNNTFPARHLNIEVILWMSFQNSSMKIPESDTMYILCIEY